MRTVLLSVLLTVTALAGCISEDADTDSVAAEFQGESHTEFQNASHAEKPSKRWEPEWMFESVVDDQVVGAAGDTIALESGATIKFQWDVTDLGDYEYPTNFIDYTLHYERLPDAIAEGSAEDLEDSTETTLFKVAFHNFTLNYQDGQGLNVTQQIIIQIGEPCAEDNAQYGCPMWGVVIEAEEAATSSEVVDREMAYWRTDSSYCGETASGNLQGVNAVWYDIDPETRGQYFHTAFSTSSGALTAGIRWAAGSDTIAYQSDTDSGEYYEIDGTVPETATRVYFFSCGGYPGLMSAFYQTGIPEEGSEFLDDPACATDKDVTFFGAAGSGFYSTEYEAVETTGSLWVYQESNGISGLQRNDSTWGSRGNCANADTIIF